MPRILSETDVADSATGFVWPQSGCSLSGAPMR